jgi:N-acetylglucosaminyldiphosphoundecaprenol N-acetyl-beta-D-mannosaminyltransferase
VVNRGRTSGLRHFFFGGDRATLAHVTERLRAEYQGVEIAGSLAPPIGSHTELQGEFIDRIAAADPDVIWCSLGAPKQELWMADVAARFPNSVLVGVGAAFDFVAGRKRRAPRLVRHLGLEWAHRLLSEPRRLWKRYLVTNTGFAVLVFAATCAVVARRGMRLLQRRLGIAK